jgi:hypothetical protein
MSFCENFIQGDLLMDENTLKQALHIFRERKHLLLIDIMKKTPFLGSESQARELDNINTDGFSYFEGLMEEPHQVQAYEF